MTLAHRTPDAGSAKVAVALSGSGFNSPLKTTRAISFTVTPVLTLLRAKCYVGIPLVLVVAVRESSFRAAFDPPQPDEKRTVVVVIKRRLPLLLAC